MVLSSSSVGVFRPPLNRVRCHWRNASQRAGSGTWADTAILSRLQNSRRPFSSTLDRSTQKERLITSFVSGPTTPALLEDTLPSYFAGTILRNFADRSALISRHERPQVHGGPLQVDGKVLRWTYEELDRHVRALSRGLKDMGVKKGERVGVIMGNCRLAFQLSTDDKLNDLGMLSAYAMLQWACARVGAILVTVNPAYRTHEIVGFHNLRRIFLS